MALLPTSAREGAEPSMASDAPRSGPSTTSITNDASVSGGGCRIGEMIVERSSAFLPPWSVTV
jgi:hypothetical protein